MVGFEWEHSDSDGGQRGRAIRRKDKKLKKKSRKEKIRTVFGQEI
jgi:hypothetical protein